MIKADIHQIGNIKEINGEMCSETETGTVDLNFIF